jgi:hypothetical protein
VHARPSACAALNPPGALRASPHQRGRAARPARRRASLRARGGRHGEPARGPAEAGCGRGGAACRCERHPRCAGLGMARLVGPGLLAPCNRGRRQDSDARSAAVEPGIRATPVEGSRGRIVWRPKGGLHAARPPARWAGAGGRPRAAQQLAPPSFARTHRTVRRRRQPLYQDPALCP